MVLSKFYLARLCLFLTACTGGTVPSLVAAQGCSSADSTTAPAGTVKAVGIDPGEARGRWTLEATEDATAVIAFGGVEVGRFTYRFWTQGWEWAQTDVEVASLAGDKIPFSLAVPKLGLRGKGEITKSFPGTFVFEYDLTATQAMRQVTGGGVEFKLRLDDVIESSNKPQLLPDNKGFEWEAKPGQKLRVTFDKPLEKLHFERNNPETIRAFFFADGMEPGNRKVTMRIELPKDGAIVRSLDERYGPARAETWHEGVLSWDQSPVDLSFLNAADRPAGKRGRVQARGDGLVFADGTPARFWGTNIAAQALFQGSREDIVRQAKRLSAFGFNLVRIHHHDSRWVRPNVFGAHRRGSALDDKALEQIDWWVKALQDEGIYVWIDLHVQREFVAQDGIPGLQELRASKGEGKGFNYVNPDIERAMQTFAWLYLDRKNRFTGKRYADDPGVVAVLVTNENDLTFHGARHVAPKSGNTYHAKQHEAFARAFAKRHNLPVSAAANPHKFGAGKVVLNELEARFGLRALEHLRKLGYQGLVATTNFWGKPPLMMLPPLTVGDIIDVHAYGVAEFLSSHPLYDANFIAWIGSGQVAGKPLTISEWNVEYPARDRFAAPLYVAGTSALQGWDAPMFYIYLQQPVRAPKEPAVWTSFDDPALMAMMPTAALLYRQGHVAPAKKTYRLRPDLSYVYDDLNSARKSNAIRTLVEQSKIEIELPQRREFEWDKPAPEPEPGTLLVDDLTKSFLPADAQKVRSDTGQLERDFVKGTYRIDTPQTQAVAGWIGGESVELADVTFAVKPPKAALAVTSLDGQPIASSKRMLVTAVARVLPKGEKQLPWRSEPIAGSISIATKVDGLRLQPLSGRNGKRLAPVEGKRSGGRLVFELPANVPTHWFLLSVGE